MILCEKGRVIQFNTKRHFIIIRTRGENMLIFAKEK